MNLPGLGGKLELAPSVRPQRRAPCRQFNTLEYSPQCGSDGKTYGNMGALEIHNCNIYPSKVTVMHYGSCHKPCPSRFCLRDRTLCASDGKTYSNVCSMCRAWAKLGKSSRAKLKAKHPGACKTEPAELEQNQEYEDCSEGTLGCNLVELLPTVICGSNGKTYKGHCALKKANCRSGTRATIKHIGPCKTEPQGNKDCSQDKLGCSLVDLLPTVLCGSDGNTYNDHCSLKAANCRRNMNASIKHIGSCEEGPAAGRVSTSHPFWY